MDSGCTDTVGLGLGTGAQVRVVTVEGEPWFVTRDLCAILGIANSGNALAGLEENEKGIRTVDTLGGPKKVGVCNESGLYALIFESRKPDAKRFRQWVTSEVLPSIRKTGAYVALDSVSGALDLRTQVLSRSSSSCPAWQSNPAHGRGARV
ncbi:Bro-N domain-containing protein [Burkholderia vietnamiensis]|uniref:BRO-N domain-containing protein n=1 Tax=Burkholderia vietnamiensis TaxID=60552 RepID=UPI002ED80B98